MPDLDSQIHISMYNEGKKNRSRFARLKKAARILFGSQDIYGLEWGDPDSVTPLTYVRDHFLLPYVRPDINAIEIGPGGGRWTRYMTGVGRLYAVDYHQELLDELKTNFQCKNIHFIKNNGDDFPGVSKNSIDLVFSFGVFVHLDTQIIDRYLKSIKPLLKSGANVIIQYSDKTKPLARSNDGFSENEPETMRRLVIENGYFVYEEDTQSLWHSAVIRFGVDSV